MKAKARERRHDSNRGESCKRASRLESQDSVVALGPSPAGRQFENLAFEIEKLKPHESEIIGYDFQCSSQKSVSIVARLGRDDRLLEAHKQAVTEAYEKLESLACVKEGTLGIDRQRVTTGVLCSARFEHDTSRALDPHIHIHFATSNFFITPEGRRYALETHDMVKAIRYCGKIYQSALRRKVEELGYRTSDKFNERGQLEGFEIDGISDELCEKYSQRRGEIEERIADLKAEYGRPLVKNHTGRTKKRCREGWREHCRAFGEHR